MRIDYGKGEMEAIASIETLMLYEQEFDGDLIADCLGRLDLEDGVLLDFSNTNWTNLIKALWACLKTADPSIPGFSEWARSVGNADLMTLRTELLPELARRFFPLGDDAPEN